MKTNIQVFKTVSYILRIMAENYINLIYVLKYHLLYKECMHLRDLFYIRARASEPNISWSCCMTSAKMFGPS